MNQSFNITLKELRDAAEFAEKFGVSDFKTIKMHVGNETGLITSLNISSDKHLRLVDITEVESM